MIYIRCDASHNIGWGHLKRSLVLAEQLNKMTQTTFLITAPSPHMCDLIHAAGAAILTLPEGLSHSDEFAHYPADMRHIILDLSHRDNLDASNEFVDYLNRLAVADIETVIIDGLDDDSFRDVRAPKIKAYVQPYWGVAEEEKPNAEHWLFGAPYVLLDQKYHNAFRDRSDGDMHNILITFGGADPQENTLKVLEGVRSLSHEAVRFRVIIGPSFSHDAIVKTNAVAAQHKHIETVFKPDGLKLHYDWADLCIGGSSTTRYEAAACGLPMMFAAIYKEHIKLSQTFATYGTSTYIGYADELMAHDWKNALSALLHDRKAVIKMSNKIKKMKLNEPGAKRLSLELFNMFQVK